MRRVYIAHPYGGSAENRELAIQFFMRAAELGYEPVAPWLIVTAHWDESRREQGMAINRSAVLACHQLWLCGAEVSPGMLDEARWFAQHRNFPARNTRRFITLDDLAFESKDEGWE